MRSVLREYRQSVLSTLRSVVPSSSCSRRSDWSCSYLLVRLVVCEKEHVWLAGIDRGVPEGSGWIDCSDMEIPLGKGDFHVVFTEGVVDAKIQNFKTEACDSKLYKIKILCFSNLQ